MGHGADAIYDDALLSLPDEYACCLPSAATSGRWGRAWRWWPTRRCAAFHGMVAGGNKPDIRLRGVEPGRDFEPTWADVRTVEAGDTSTDGATIRIEPAIEVGNIFKLGTRYSEPLGATLLDGKREQLLDGLVRDRTRPDVAAAVEQFADERGISWPARWRRSTSEIVGLGKEGEEAREVGGRLYEELAGRV